MGFAFVIFILDEIAAGIPIAGLIGELVPDSLTIPFVCRLSNYVRSCSVLKFSFRKKTVCKFLHGMVVVTVDEVGENGFCQTFDKCCYSSNQIP